jgi:hypothetical protein
MVGPTHNRNQPRHSRTWPTQAQPTTTKWPGRPCQWHAVRAHTGHDHRARGQHGGRQQLGGLPTTRWTARTRVGSGGGGVSAEQGEGPAELTEQHGDGGVAIRGRIGGVRRWQRRSPAGSDPEAAREGKWSGEVQRNRQGK